MVMTNKDLLEDGDIIADGFDLAIEGVMLSVDEHGKVYRRVVYDTDMIIEILMADGISEADAMEYFDFNVIGAYVGKQTPVYIPRVWS